MQKIDINNSSNCCGCGACQYVCPSMAINLVKDGEGYLYPQIDKDKCINCGLCFKSCAIQNDEANSKEYNNIQTYAVKHKDHVVRINSRSGGAFTALSDWILDNGGVVYGAMLDRSDHVKHFRATNKKERDLLRGSKYVQSHTEHIYSQIKDDLKLGKKVFFTGTPCQCASIAAVFNPKQYNNLHLCDFICHGIPSEKLLSDYLLWIEKKYHSEIIEFDFRDKKKFNWENHIEKIILKSKTIYSRRFANLFYNNCCLRPSCYTCKYTTINRITDFTIGDYWGIKEIAPSFYDNKGISLVIIRSEKAKMIFEKIQEFIDKIETTEYKLEHYNLYRPTEKPSKREDFWKDYFSKGFLYVSNKYGGYDILHRIKYKILDHYD